LASESPSAQAPGFGRTASTTVLFIRPGSLLFATRFHLTQQTADFAVAEKLWEISEQLTGAQWDSRQ
jgi:hypothetical protein